MRGILLAFLLLAGPALAQPGPTPPGTAGNSAGNPVYAVEQNGAGTCTAANPCFSSLPNATQVSFSTTASGVPTGFPLDASGGYPFLVVQMVSIGTGNTIFYETSEDNSTWVTQPCRRESDGLSTTSVAGTGRYDCRVGRYFRLEITVYGSGTIAGVVTMSATGALAPGDVGQIAFNAPPIASTSGVTNVASSAAEGKHIAKASAGLLYSADVNAVTGCSGVCTLMIFNATSVPADGTVTPARCTQVLSNYASLSNIILPEWFATGISLALSTGATCNTLTTGAATGLFSWRTK